MSARVYVGLSGGVDSALACALLVERGHDVTAVYMRNWSRDLPGFRCPWAAELADAERIAVTVGCELVVWDFEELYRQTVVDYVIDSYRHGRTPNPDVVCNQTIKFGAFARRAFDEGADLIATGHYARVRTASHAAHDPYAVRAAAFSPKGQARSEHSELLRARDEHKDQTYFLWRVPGTVFAQTLFPIGDFASKKDVRRACAARHLGVEQKPDSDGMCFVGPVGIRTFLLDALKQRAGDVVEWETGKVIGRHDGAFLYTVGQRRGLGLGGGPARYVVTTDVDKNIVYVTADRSCPGLWTTELLLEDVCWISGIFPTTTENKITNGEKPLCVPREFLVRTRHTGALVPARIEPGSDGGLRVVFAEPQRRVAPGQSAVIYDGLRCLGGGLICGPAPER